MPEKTTDRTTTSAKTATAPKDPQPENMGGALGGEPLKEGVPPTGDAPGPQAAQLNEDLLAQQPSANTLAPDYNPTTPDGSPPPNNLPGPHGPQGVEHLQEDPSEK
jgi:hypothetical protein